MVRRAGWWLVALALGCTEPTEEAVAEAPPEVALRVPEEPVARSPEELAPPPPPAPHAEISGAFAAASYERARRVADTDPDAARQLYERGCDGGFVPSCLALADLLEATDPERARGVREQACAEGAAEACDRLGH